jgi:chromosome segregation ATPase
MDHSDRHIPHESLVTEIERLEKLLQEAERKNAYYEEVIDQKQSELEQFHHQEEDRQQQIEALETKLDRAEKANERLKTTYEVLREQELHKVKQELRTNEEKERAIQGYKDQIDSQQKDITGLTDRVADLTQQLKHTKADIERLTLDKEALARIADTSGFEQKIKTLETDLAHYKSLLENERRSRQTVTDSMNKRDSQLNELERVNFELTSQVDLKNNIIKRNEEEIDHLKYQLSDSVKENNDLRLELKEQNDRIHELEEDLAQ